MMKRLSDSITSSTLRGLLAVALLLSGAIFYLVSLVAIHASIAFISALYERRYGDHSRNALIAGALAGLVWAVVSSVILGLVAGSGTFLPTAFVLSLPLASVVGWQVWSWAQPTFWSKSRSSLVLGEGSRNIFLVKHRYVITGKHRLKHLAISGATGSGKSALIKNLIANDIRNGAGLCVIDPKDSSLIDDILGYIPEEREKDVILLDLTLTDRPLGFNPLSNVPPERWTLAASEFISVLRRYFSESWGARLQHVLTMVVLALLEFPGATLLDVSRLLLEPEYRSQVLSKVTNPGVQQFFQVEFSRFLERRGDAIEPILNKIGPWMSYPELRNIIGQSTSSFDLRWVMDTGKILLVKIPQGALGEAVSSLLGSLIVAKIQMAAHSRIDVSEEKRRPFYLWVDEFQNFEVSSFAKIVTEARSFKLGLICANQYPEQLSRELQLAMLHNIATTVHALHQDGKYILQVSSIEDKGKQVEPIILTPPAPLPAGDPKKIARIRLMSTGRYGRPREEVEREILGKLQATSPSKSVNTATKVKEARVDIDEE